MNTFFNRTALVFSLTDVAADFSKWCGFRVEGYPTKQKMRLGDKNQLVKLLSKNISLLLIIVNFLFVPYL